MKLKSIVTKSIAAAAFTIAGIAAVNTFDNNDAQAAIVQNDAATYKVTKATTVYNYYENGAATSQVLAANTNWKVIQTAYDFQCNKWYDLGDNQWVKVPTASVKTSSTSTANYASYAKTSSTSSAASSTTTSSTSTYTSTATGSEASAKAWIANKESGGSYTAKNGQYIGKYQLSASLLGGNYSASNQEKVADNYVNSRYGSWTAAKKFWEANGWY